MTQPSSLSRSSFNDGLIIISPKGRLSMTEMWAMELGAVGGPLRLVARAIPDPGPGELLIKVIACGVCRTDLHIVDGEVTAQLPIIPGHEIVGIVAAIGEGVTGFLPGDRVGVPWLGHSCGRCDHFPWGRENRWALPRPER